MARMIDLDVALDRYYAEYERQDICDGSQDRDWLMRCLEEAPNLTPPNEPLTEEQLREIDCPVWCACKPIEGGNGYWCLCKRGHIITPAGSIFSVQEMPHWVFYRRPPEEEDA